MNFYYFAHGPAHLLDKTLEVAFLDQIVYVFVILVSAAGLAFAQVLPIYPQPHQCSVLPDALSFVIG